ncbi:hypothetical protein Vadar_032242 [Vaccinium darrowii]|uniref:Uncharacterized protein n=1 Tax=Vaccinium darrowii TaxID=229202 RepID=A0ACB7XV12_9ERIC|nr:hypothetical protein Vadar_032242 [Vaccinium darrowii]
MYGIGYDSVSDDYKVVRAIRPSRKNVPCDVHVFSSKHRSWDWIDDFGYMFYVWRPGMVLNGPPHWVVGRFGLGMGSVIVYFDAIEEKFKEIPSPEGEDILVDWRSLVSPHGRMGRKDKRNRWTRKRKQKRPAATYLGVISSAQRNPIS